MAQPQSTAPAGEYVLGTTDEEIERLGIQHRVWRPKAADAWQRAGFTEGNTIVDVGCGPGYATIDLAEIVGATGRVVAIDRSARFLHALENTSRQRGLGNIEIHACDFDASYESLPVMDADGIWCRWVLSFVREPAKLLANIVRSLKPGGTLVLHEYFDYRTWRVAPRSLLIEEFVATVMQSWREHGGEPDIALEIPQQLGELGMTVQSVRPLLDVVSPTNYVARWPSAFLEINLARLVELEMLPATKADAMRTAMREHAALPHALMITPAVLEIIAVRS